MDFGYSAELRYDFKTPEKAAIAATSMRADEDLKPEESLSVFSSDGQFLVFQIQARSSKFLKKAITTTVPSIELIEQTINAFALD